METVQNTTSTTYKAVMDQYYAKAERAREISQQPISLKSIEKHKLALPEIPKCIETIASRVSLGVANNSSHSLISNSSFGNVFKAQRIITE
jgi:glyceraldehyde-3-phosphate dehydrogenase/erythrose-4-phosphate dehydrogenase